jgi:tight adherence protein C
VIYLIGCLIAATVALVFLAIAETLPARPRAVERRLAEVRQIGRDAVEVVERRRRQERRERLEEFLRQAGKRLEGSRDDGTAVRRLLIQSGFRHPNAVSIYWGSRLLLAGTLAVAGLVLAGLVAARPQQVFLWLVSSAILGWIGPSFYVGRQRRRRIKDLQQALADTLDLLVVCVEAGLGLNQALVRVAGEIRHVSRTMSEEFHLVNLEIRAGVERAEALRNLSERTAVDDLRALTSVLIQTDRFGTSVATALRTQSDTLRVKRRQRAEESAAKTTIKIVLPLAFCIFPAIFAVILGPAMIQLLRFFAEMNR